MPGESNREAVRDEGGQVPDESYYQLGGKQQLIEV